jgi:hypothetical protein
MSVPSTQVPWWLEHIAGPMLFTLFGAILGFSLGRVKDWLDDRKARKVFLNAIRVELSVIQGHLEGTLKDATEVRDKLGTQEQVALHLVTVFQIGIYSSQVGKLKNVLDPLVIEIIQFYDRLSNLERIKSRLTEVSFELTTVPKGNGDEKAAIAAHYRTTLDELIKRINQLLPVADALIRKLPKE